jgi:uncharacterized protein YbaR (Trm112 family)
MHILLTDVLTCPRCGPGLGLVLLADRIDERRVLEGWLGCANCREQYPVRGGAADLRTGPLASTPESEVPDVNEAAVRVAALLGLANARGNVLVAGPGAKIAPALAALLPEAEVVALSPEPAPGPETPGVSRIAAGPALPFRGRTLRGAALTGGADAALLAEGLRVVAPGARVLVEGAAPDTADTLRALGAEVLLDQEGTVVARSPAVPS